MALPSSPSHFDRGVKLALGESVPQDLAAARASGLEPAMVDRLALTPKVIDSMIEGLRQVATLPDPIGEIQGKPGIVQEIVGTFGARFYRIQPIHSGWSDVEFIRRPDVCRLGPQLTSNHNLVPLLLSFGASVERKGGLGIGV